MSAVPAIKYISIEDYLSLEETAEEKHEYYRGEIFAMAGGTIAHNQIVSNTVSEINYFLREKNCQVFPSDLKVHNEANSLFTYPDISIVCGEPQKWQDRNDTITNPVVIIEVLSESTQLYDRGQKFKLYRNIPSLKEYLLLSSLEYMVEHYTRQADETWNFRELSNPEDRFTIESIDFSCPIKELYRNVSFE
ncbi:Uma2 family endonuclease [Flavisolibacter sp. BT320]|nr:Uma2 family endonuclease [Flavisolibacter longurius]